MNSIKIIILIIFRTLVQQPASPARLPRPAGKNIIVIENSPSMYVCILCNKINGDFKEQSFALSVIMYDGFAKNKSL